MADLAREKVEQSVIYLAQRGLLYLQKNDVLQMSAKKKLQKVINLLILKYRIRKKLGRLVEKPPSISNAGNPNGHF